MLEKYRHVATKPCHRDILNSGIKYKKRELSQLYRYSNRLKADLSSSIDHMVFVRIRSIIESLETQLQNKWRIIHEKKLSKLREQQRPPSSPTQSFEYPKNPVRNFSKRQLTDDEIDALSNGLDFVFPGSKFDDETVVANMETFFVSLLGHTTN